VALLFLDLLGDLLDCRDDIGVGSAPAKVAAHTLANLHLVELHLLSSHMTSDSAGPPSLSLTQHADGRAKLARGAVAALKGVVGDERPLEWVQALTIGQPLNGDNVSVLMGDGQGEAAIHAPPIKQDRTGAALPVVASFLRAGESEPLTQGVQESRSCINRQLADGSIDAKANLTLHQCSSLSLLSLNIGDTILASLGT
jgi:hypothetical protein